MSQNYNITDNVMEISNYRRKQIRRKSNLTLPQFKQYKKDSGLTTNQAYAQLVTDLNTTNPPDSPDQQAANKKQKNKITNRRYREAKRARQNIGKIDRGEIESFTVNLGPMGLQNDMKKVTSILTKSNKRLLLDIGGQTYTLNDIMIESFQKFLEEGVITLTNGAITESDTEVIKAILQFDRIRVSFVPTNTIGNTSPKGGFFPYYHRLECVDLERYGIFGDDQEGITYPENCFVHALMMGGVDDKIIAHVKTKIKCRYLPMKNIKMICDECDLYIEISRVVFGENTKDKVKKYGNKNATHKLKLGLVEEHYFIIDDKIKITEWAIKNYHILEQLEISDWKRRRSLTHFGSFAKSSFRIIKCLLLNKANVLKKISKDDLYATQYYDKITKLETLEYPEGSAPPHSMDVNRFLKEKDYSITDYRSYEPLTVYFDFETNTSVGDKKQHVPYLVRCKPRGGENIGFYGADCGEQMMSYLAKKYERNKLVMIAHNCGYDFRFLKQLLHRQQLIENGSFLIFGSGIYYSKSGTAHPIVFKDSYRMISMKLADFGSMFGLEQEKDLMFYDLYTTNNITKKHVDVTECLSHAKNNSQRDQFLANCNKWNCIKNGLVDIIKYSDMYCVIDINVLEAGYESFRDKIKIISNTKKAYVELGYTLDIDNYYTISSVADELLKADGCYDDTCQLQGVPREFIQRCVVGGRTMLCDNKKQYIEKRVIKDKKHRHYNKKAAIQDFDGVSLYPSAMVRMDGFIRGTPKVITNLTKEFVASVDAYFIKIKINKVKQRLKFPLLSFINKDKVRSWTNDCVGEFLYCDKIMLEDWVKYQKIEFEIIEGYYFDEGYNIQVNDTMRTLFEERLKYKSEGNKIEKVYKLIMNSAYGRSMMKEHETETKYIPKGKVTEKFPLGIAFSNYLNKNYNFIKSYVLDLTGKTYQVKQYNTIEDHKNSVHQGVSILSTSKRIMNEVMCTAEDIGLDMYYTDTDSIHIMDLDVPLLACEFKIRFGRELIGKNLGQFHNDFDLSGCNNVYSDLFIGLGKKCYLDNLIGMDTKGNLVNGSHIRMKGAPTYSVKGAAYNKGWNLKKLYDSLFVGNKEVFDLCKDEYGKPHLKFKFNSDFSITNYNDDASGFQRILQFK